MATEKFLLELMRKHKHPGPLLCSVLSDSAIHALAGKTVEVLHLPPSNRHALNRPTSGILESWSESYIMLRHKRGIMIVLGRDQIREIKLL